MVFLGAAATAAATVVTAPEIDANSAVAAVALIAGGLVVIRGRRRR